MTALYRYGILALVILALVGGAWVGVKKVNQAFSDRTELQGQVKVLQSRLEDEAAATDAARKSAQDTAKQLEAEIKLRATIANVANIRNEQITKDLSHAKNKLAEWERKAGPDVARCLDLVVPVGTVSMRPAAPGGKTDTGAAGNPGNRADAADGVHAADPGAAAAEQNHQGAAGGSTGVPRGPGHRERATRGLVQVGK